MSTDRETIRSWAEEHDAVPARDTGERGEGGRYRLLSKTEVGTAHEEVSWDEFDDALEDDDLVVVYHAGAPADPLEVVDTDDLSERIDDESMLSDLREGRTVETDLVDTTVVESVVVEEVTLESELVDSTVTDQRVVDAQLLDRTCTDARLVDDEHAAAPTEGWFGADRYLETAAEGRPGGILEEHAAIGSDVEAPFTAELDVEETWEVTRDYVEEFTVESAVADAETAEADTVADHDVDVSGLHRSIVERGILEQSGADVVSEMGSSGMGSSETSTGGAGASEMDAETAPAGTDGPGEGAATAGEPMESDTSLAADEPATGHEAEASEDPKAATDPRTSDDTAAGGRGAADEPDHRDAADPSAETGVEEHAGMEDEPAVGAGAPGGGETSPTDPVDPYEMESEFDESDAITTTVSRPRRVVDEVVERKRLFVDVTGGERLDQTVVGREHRADADAETAPTGATDAGTPAQGGTEPVASDSTPAAGEPATGDAEPAPAGGEAGTAPAEITEDAVGSVVVDDAGEEIGMVSAVDEDAGRMHVDVHPGITERIMAALGWGGADEDDYPIGTDAVAAVTDDEVRLKAQEELHEGVSDR